MISQVAASEKEGAQTDLRIGVEGPSPKRSVEHRRMSWEAQPQGVKVPYPKCETRVRWHLSTAGHEESCRNQPGPSGKAKYEIVTDSEPVP